MASSKVFPISFSCAYIMSSPTRPIGKIRMRDLNVILSSHLFPHIINREVNTHSISHHMNRLNNQVVYIYITRKRRSTIQNKTRTTSNATQQSGKGPISLTQDILEIKKRKKYKKTDQQGRGNTLLDSEHHAFLRLQPDRGRTQLQ